MSNSHFGDLGQNRITNANFVIETLTSLGFEPAPGSRLRRMQSVLHSTNGLIPASGRPNFEVAIESVRDMQLLGFILRQDFANTGDVKFKDNLRKLIKDNDLPEKDRQKNSPGRNAQFELLVAAVCLASEFAEVQFDEPDVRCDVAGFPICIAAKRIKGPSQCEKHISKAAYQIQKARRPGIIALDTCLHLNHNNKRIERPMPDELFSQIYEEAIRQCFYGRHQEMIRQRTGGKGVIGLIVHDHQVRIAEDGEWSLESMNSSYKLTADTADNVLFDCFWDMYRSALPHSRPV